MPVTQQTFRRANTDDVVPPSTDFVRGLNLHLAGDSVYPATGNVLVPGYALPASGTKRGLGGFEDGATGVAYYLLYNGVAGSNRFVRYDPNAAAGAGASTTLIEWAGLNLSETLCVQGGILDGLFIYLGADGYLRCINLARANAGYYTNVLLAADPYACHLVKVPATVGPVAVRQTLTGPDPRLTQRIIQDKAYQFAIRWRYLDGEVTVLSDWSDWLDVVESPDTTSSNAIGITLPPVPAGVTEVELLVRQADGLDWQIADTLRRVAGAMPTAYTFYGIVSGATLTVAESGRLFESEWPARAAVIGRGRPFKADFPAEGYPTPEPAFTATLVSGNAQTVSTQTVYRVHYQLADLSYADVYWLLVSGTYPDPPSTYHPVFPSGGGYVDYNNATFSYASAFVTSYYQEKSPQNRTVTPLAAQTVTTYETLTQTAHENTTYRVAIQYNDAQGKSGGASQAKTVAVPAQNMSALQLRSFAVALTTTGTANLNAEIPEWAVEYQVVVADNDVTGEFRQGVTADVAAYLGQQRIINTDGSTKEVALLAVRSTPHDRLRIDIGNWPAAGLGYVWVPGSGDKVRFLDGVGEVFPITGQFGDYIEVAWNSSPAVPVVIPAQLRIEIFTPNTAAGDTYYERGPRLKIIRDGSGNRSYQTTTIAIQGDCFLAALNFPVLDTSGAGVYVPPDKKKYITNPAGAVLVESMVPAYRLAPRRTTTNTKSVLNYVISIGGAAGDELAKQQKKANEQLAARAANTSTVDTAARDATALLWLDMSYGGRPALQIPLALQVVSRPTLIRFGGVKQQGNRINGLSQWDALSQYGEVAQELGPIVRLAVADQTQALGSILYVVQQRGEESLSLGQSQIQTATGQELLAISKQVIGGANALRGGYGSDDPRSVVPYAGKVFSYCRRRREALRYDRNGVSPLAFPNKFLQRIEQVERDYGRGEVVAGFDPRRQEYWLTWQGAESTPAFTLVWNERYDAWADACSGHPEAFAGVGSELVTWQNGALWRHPLNAPVGNFFGAYTAPELTFVCAMPFNTAKRWMSYEVVSESLWVATTLTTPTGQASRTRPEWWSYRESIWRLANGDTSGIRRNENTPGFPGIWEAIQNGSPMVGNSLTTTFRLNSPSNDPLYSIGVGWSARVGQGLGA